MLHLPILVAAGGINSAGRTSHRHGFKRMVIEQLSQADQRDTRHALSNLMGVNEAHQQDAGTLIRAIESTHFSPGALPWARRINLDQSITATMSATQVMSGLSPDLAPSLVDDRRTRVSLPQNAELLLPGTRAFDVGAAGQLPTGFHPGELYPSRSHPRALQMGIYAASDALADLGLSWEDIASQVAPDAISVYVSSAMGQLDEEGSGGMLRGRALGKRVTSKQCPFGFAEMAGDFISAYVLRSMGNTGPALGACATFLYNLQLAVQDIRAGRARVAIVGAAEAPIVPEVMEGYAAMGALATDKGLRALDNLSADDMPNWRNACRPFGDNCGFTMAESAQVVVLFDDALAMEMGAPMLAAVPDVAVSADGAKKSISGPGAGNYITVAKAASVAAAIVGEQRFRRGGMVQSHGTGTPQNRVTESTILSRVAQAFGVEAWPVGAIKSFIGHSLGAAAGDQLSAMLGVWETGVLPGINTIGAIADDVATERLMFPLHTATCEQPAYALINSKGFGGNNATATLLSPSVTQELLRRHYGQGAYTAWASTHEQTERSRQEIESTRLAGTWTPTYQFNEGVLTDEDVEVGRTDLCMAGRVIPLAPDLPVDWLHGQTTD